MADSLMSNDNILQALKMLGFLGKDEDVDIKGKQHGEFATRLAGYGVTDQQFVQAQAFVGFLGNWDAKGDFFTQFKNTLSDGGQKTGAQIFDQMTKDRFAKSGGAGLNQQFQQELSNFQDRAMRMAPPPQQNLD